MNSVQFVQIIRHALPGCHIEQLYLEQQTCRVKWAGEVFDISARRVPAVAGDNALLPAERCNRQGAGDARQHE
jgi:hypothetical protein